MTEHGLPQRLLRGTIAVETHDGRKENALFPPMSTHYIIFGSDDDKDIPRNIALFNGVP